MQGGFRMSCGPDSIRSVRIFADLPLVRLQELDGISRKVSIPAGEFVFRAGDPARSSFVILSGHVTVELHTADLGFVVLETYGPQDLLGWSWLLPPHLYRFDARARTDIQVLDIDGEALRHICETDKDFGYFLMKTMLSVFANRLGAARLRILDAYSVVKK